MLAQLKTVVLIREAIKLAFLWASLEHQHFGIWLYSQNGQKKRTFFSNSTVYSCSEKWRLFHARNCQEIEDFLQQCTTPFREQHKWALARIERDTTKQEDKYIRVSSLRNRRLTGPQLAASLNGTRKMPVSTSTVKRRLRDAGLLGRVAKKKPYLRLANDEEKIRMGKRTQTLDRGRL